jgi:CBS domain containing-hemolysin-like protein
VTTPWYLLITLGLLVANGFFVGAEFALTAARRTKIEQLAEQGSRRAQAALASMRELSFMLSGAQLGITMASLGLGFVAEPAVARLLEAALGWTTIPPAVLHTISLVVALLIVVYLHMVIGEMAPKNIAISEPERSALWMAPPFRLYANLFRPVIWLLNAVANGGTRLLGVEPRDEVEVAHSADDIATMVAISRRQGLIEEFQHRLLSGALRFGDLDVAAVMVPRTEVVAVRVDVTPAEVEGLVLQTGHSRVPVYRESLDDMIGFVHVKDLLGVPDDRWEAPLDPSIVRPLVVVPESGKIHRLLAEMRRRRNHIAVVVDEHGGTAGIVTLEDLVEELVGEIRDEYDAGEGEIRRVGAGRFVVPGSMRPDQLARPIGLKLPEGDYETVGGFVMDRLDRVPRPGDRVEHDGWLLRVRRMDGMRVAEVEIISQA